MEILKPKVTSPPQLPSNLPPPDQEGACCSASPYTMEGAVAGHPPKRNSCQVSRHDVVLIGQSAGHLIRPQAQLPARAILFCGHQRNPIRDISVVGRPPASGNLIGANDVLRAEAGDDGYALRGRIRGGSFRK